MKKIATYIVLMMAAMSSMAASRAVGGSALADLGSAYTVALSDYQVEVYKALDGSDHVVISEFFDDGEKMYDIDCRIAPEGNSPHVFAFEGKDVFNKWTGKDVTYRGTLTLRHTGHDTLTMYIDSNVPDDCTYILPQEIVFKAAEEASVQTAEPEQVAEQVDDGEQVFDVVEDESTRLQENKLYDAIAGRWYNSDASENITMELTPWGVDDAGTPVYGKMVYFWSTRSGKQSNDEHRVLELVPESDTEFEVVTDCNREPGTRLIMRMRLVDNDTLKVTVTEVYHGGRLRDCYFYQSSYKFRRAR